MKSNRQITSDEDVRKLIDSGQWSQHRKTVARRVAYVGVAVVALPLATIGLLRHPSQEISTTAPVVARAEAPNPVQQPQEQPQQVAAVVSNRSQNPVEVAKSAMPQQDASMSESVAQAAYAQPQQEFAMATEQPKVEHRDILAEIQETEYSMIVWNDYSEADTIVDRLNHFLIKKGV